MDANWAALWFMGGFAIGVIVGYVATKLGVFDEEG